MSTENVKTNHILIIEDEPDICLLLNIMLSDEGTEMNHVKNISNAKTFLDASTPDLVVLDNRLPDGLGVDFIKELKYHAPKTKILMISGAGEEVRELAMENGADAFLPKPFNKKEVYEIVSKLLN